MTAITALIDLTGDCRFEERYAGSTAKVTRKKWWSVLIIYLRLNTLKITYDITFEIQILCKPKVILLVGRLKKDKLENILPQISVRHQ